MATKIIFILITINILAYTMSLTLNRSAVDMIVVSQTFHSSSSSSSLESISSSHPKRTRGAGLRLPRPDPSLVP